MDALKKETKRYHHGDLRGALIEAVRFLIERDGAEAFKVAEACRIAGVSTAAPYKHFRDREQIVRAVALAGMERLGHQMRSAADAFQPGDLQRVAALGQSYLRFARDEPGIFRLVFGLSAHHAEDADLQAVGMGINRFVEQVVGQHLGRPSESEDVRLRAYALWCFVHGHAFLNMDGKLKSQEPPVPEGMLLAAVGRAMLADEPPVSGGGA